MNSEDLTQFSTITTNVPKELAITPQWVSWSGTLGPNGKISKIPINPWSGKNAEINTPDTWGTFDQAVKFSWDNNLPGIGFVFTKNDDFVGIDLDDCFDPDTGSTTSEAQEIINHLDTYTEISPSGRGVHIIAKGALPPGSRKAGKVEIYDARRFFTITGKTLNGSPARMMERSKEILDFYQSLFPPPEAKADLPSNQKEADDQVLIEMAKSAENSQKFKRLWDGDFSAYPSHSEADLALCQMLAYWTKQDGKESTAFSANLGFTGQNGTFLISAAAKPMAKRRLKRRSRSMVRSTAKAEGTPILISPRESSS